LKLKKELIKFTVSNDLNINKNIINAIPKQLRFYKNYF
jgi:hypothetical protein